MGLRQRVLLLNGAAKMRGASSNVSCGQLLDGSIDYEAPHLIVWFGEGIRRACRQNTEQNINSLPDVARSVAAS